MSIPQLSSCCCGCTLKTGTKIIGWLMLIGAVLSVITFSFGLAGIYYIQDHPEVVTPEANQIREHMPALKATTIFIIVVQLLSSGLALMLLLGAYQNKAKLVKLWVIIALTILLIEQAVNIVQVFTYYQSANVFSFIFFLVDLYFILVVYSFYREIENVSNYP